MKTPHEPLVEQAMQALRQLFTCIHAAEPAWLELDLTVGQIKGLFALAHQGPMTIGQVAEVLHVGTPWASVLVDRLVELGLVERTEDSVDRRRTFARLSPSGEELVVQVREGGRERLRDGLEKIAADDLAALVRGLDALLATTAAGRPHC